MAIKLDFTKHAYAFPTKVLAGNGGEHILNVELTADTDNGTIISAGDYVSFDQYKQAAAPGSYAAKIVDVAADGNFYVEVVTPADALLVCEVVEIAENYDSRFTDPKNFYNATGKTVRAYVLHKHDIYELSAEGFDNTPAVGKSLTIVNGKHHVAE